MPCNNEHQPLCLEGTSNSVIPDEDSKTRTATFETNGDIIEERRVNICATENTVTSHNQTVLSEQKNGLRKRTAVGFQFDNGQLLNFFQSTRSFTNLQAKDLLPGETSEEENRANMDSCTDKTFSLKKCYFEIFIPRSNLANSIPNNHRLQ